MSGTSGTHLAREALDHAEVSRRAVLGGLAPAGLGSPGLISTARAEDVPPPAGGRKVRVGIPLTSPRGSPTPARPAPTTA